MPLEDGWQRPGLSRAETGRVQSPLGISYTDRLFGGVPPAVCIVTSLGVGAASQAWRHCQ